MQNKNPTPGTLGCLASQGKLDNGQALGGSLGTWKLAGLSYLEAERLLEWPLKVTFFL